MSTPLVHKDDALEQEARAAIGPLDESKALLDTFMTLIRESGSDHERTSALYIVDRLKALGIPVTVHEPSLFLSIPRTAEVTVVAPEPRTIRSRPPAFSLSTDGGVVTGEVIYVPSRYAAGAGDLFDTPKAAEAAGGLDPVKGKIVLTEGYSMPGPVHAFEKRGAIAQIYIHPGTHIHEGICTTIWGAPTGESIERKPRTPIVCINHPDGEALAAQAEAPGGVTVSVATKLDEGWMPCLLPVVEIPGTDDPDEFLLIHGHYDSWYEGIGDNATGDAALLELARVLWGLRGKLKRSIKIAWWPGHSTGRYAGSTWFADTFADEIDERCIANLNIDSPGCADATAYEEVMWMAEAASLCSTAIADALDVTPKGMRPLRAGDYSFNQIGATAFYMLMSNIPQEERKARGFYAVGGCGGNIAWHTPTDVMDVADLGILQRDLNVYLTTILRLVNAPLYPFDYGATIDEIAGAVRGYRDAAGSEVDLQPVLADLEALRAAWQTWQAAAVARAGAASAAGAAGASERRALNAVLRRLARILVPLAYARGERFDHDPAIKFGVVPRLEGAVRLAAASAEMKPFLRTGLVRERNKVRALLRAAQRELETGEPGGPGLA